MILVQLTNHFSELSYFITRYNQNVIKALSGDYIFRPFKIGSPCEKTVEYRRHGLSFKEN